MMIDEYQDTNRPQHQLTMLMLGLENNLCVVGDDDQAIYAFRGAVVENIRGFAAEFPNTRVITLTQNYRSSEPILDFANAVISPASGRLNKELHSQCGTGARC